jgi:hypothetical protein
MVAIIEEDVEAKVMWSAMVGKNVGDVALEWAGGKAATTDRELEEVLR